MIDAVVVQETETQIVEVIAPGPQGPEGPTDWNKLTNKPTVFKADIANSTAKGVPYLDAGQVLRSSSGFVFDGEKLGVGTASPTAILHTKTAGGEGLRIQGTSSYAFIRFSDAADASTAFVGQNSTFDVFNQMNTAMRFGTNNFERMRIGANGNIGVGVSTPVGVGGSVGIHVNGPAASNPSLRLTNTDTGSTASDGSAIFVGNAASAGTGALNVYNYEAAPIALFTSATERMRIDANGNLGLGVVPSAWGAFKAIDINTVGGIAATASQVSVDLNTYYDGAGYRYKVNAVASRYQQISGAHNWFTSPSGTAGNAITFTQAMTLDASGNLGIGTTSPNNIIHAASGVGGIATQLKLQNTLTSATAGRGSAISFSGTGDTTFARIFAATSSASDSSGLLAFGTNSGTGMSERMRIDASGNVGIGTSAPGSKLEVSAGANSNGALKVSATGTVAGNFASMNFETGTAAWTVGTEASNGRFFIYSNAAAQDQLRLTGGANAGVELYAKGTGVISWYTAGSQERIRVDSAGLVGIGTSAPGYRVDVASGASSNALRLTTDAGVDVIALFKRGTTDVATVAGVFDGLNLKGHQVIRFDTGASERMRVDANGNLALGTSSASARLQVQGNTTPDVAFFQQSGTNSAIVTVNQSDAPGTNASARPVVSLRKGGTTMFNLSCDGGSSTQGLTYFESFGTASGQIFITNGSERMRLDASGNLGLGTSTPGVRLDVQGGAGVEAQVLSSGSVARVRVKDSAGNASISTTSGALLLETGSSERARFDNVGALLIGQTVKTSSERVLISYSSAGAVPRTLQLHNPNTTAGTGSLLAFSGLTNSGAQSDLVQLIGLAENATGNGALTVRVAAAGAANEVMRLTSAGVTLIGRSAQSSGGKLEVAGNIVANLPSTAPTLGTNSDMSFQLVSDTQLKILVRGSDGVTRSNTLTLA